MDWKTDYKTIIVEPGVITRIIHNEPEKMNALTIEFEKEEFPDALRQAHEDPDVKVVTFTSTGPYFCAGHDLRAATKIVGHKLPFYEEDWRRYVDYPRNFFYTLWDFPKPIICGVQGGASVGGADLAALCDITVVAEDAVFDYSIQRWGAAGGNALIYTAGWKKAAEIYLTAWNFDAQKALDLGLATKVVPPDKVEEEVMRYANIIALLPAESVTLQKLVNRFAVNKMGQRQMLFYSFECDILSHVSKSGTDAGDELSYYAARHRSLRAALEKSDEPFLKYGYKRHSAKKKE